MPVDTQRELDRTPYSSPESLRVRCPHCRKLYLVQYGDIQEAKPRFECVQCRSRFWLALNEADLKGEVIGLPVDVKDVPKAKAAVKSASKSSAGSVKMQFRMGSGGGEPSIGASAVNAGATLSAPTATINSPTSAPARDLAPCPKCFKMNEVTAKECGHCGVVISKFKNAFSIQENFPAHSAALDSEWHAVLADYGNESLHDKFLGSCQRENNLAYAAALYSQMTKLMPGDDLTNKRLTGIQRMGEMLLPPTRKSMDYRSPRRLPRVWQLPLFAGTLLVVVGFSSPVFRNMAGVGAAFIFLAIALQIQLRRR